MTKKLENENLTFSDYVVFIAFSGFFILIGVVVTLNFAPKPHIDYDCKSNITMTPIPTATDTPFTVYKKQQEADLKAETFNIEQENLCLRNTIYRFNNQ